MNSNSSELALHAKICLMLALLLLSSSIVTRVDSGSTAASSVCTGGTAVGFPPIIETRANVTSNLSAVGSGVSVEEITSPSSGYSASFVYYDTPVYSAATNKLVYYVFPAHGPDLIVMSNVDGTNAQVIGQSYANPIITSDGKMVIFASQGTSPNTASMYAINLTQTGTCKTYLLANYAFPQGAMTGGGSYAPVYYYSEFDTTANQDLIYIWQYNTIYRVFENGTSLQPVTIADPYGSTPATFHHLKPNPRFPNIIAYLWNQVGETIGTPETYVANLSNPTVTYLAFNSTSQGHENWAPNGEQLGDASWPYWVVANVLDSEGNILANNVPTSYSYSPSAPLYSEFSIEKIGPSIASANSTAAVEYAPQYCAWAPDSTFLACSSISGNRTDSQYGNMPIYLLYLNGTSRFLLSTDSLLHSYWGEPALIFLNDSNHIIYRSDRDGSPQLYEITLGSGFGLSAVSSETQSSTTKTVASSSSSSTTTSMTPSTTSSSFASLSQTISQHGTSGQTFDFIYSVAAIIVVAAIIIGFRSRRKSAS